MGKITDFFKSLPNSYYSWRRRNEKLDQLINNHNTTLEELKKLHGSFDELKGDVKDIRQEVQSINKLLTAVTKGTKMELFETLHNLRQRLVVLRGWASAEEKKEVEEIYLIYHNELEGNGNGERYYREIITLPESEEEKEKLGAH